MSAEEKQQQIIKSGRRQRGKGGGVFPGAGGKRNEQTGKRKGKRQRVGNEGGIDGAFFADRQRDPFADMVGRGVRNFDFRLVSSSFPAWQKFLTAQPPQASDRLKVTVTVCWPTAVTVPARSWVSILFFSRHFFCF